MPMMLFYYHLVLQVNKLSLIYYKHFVKTGVFLLILIKQKWLFLIKLEGSLIPSLIQFLIKLYLVQQLTNILVYNSLHLVHLLLLKNNFMINLLKLCTH